MANKFPIIMAILLLIISCSKSEENTEKSDINIETKIVKETGNYQNNNIFHIDAKIPIVSGIEFGFEDLIQKWKIHNETEKLEKTKPKEYKHEYFYHSDFEIFTNEELKITSILYSQYTTEGGANGLTTYYPINLKGNEIIKISDIISKDQLDSLIQVLREQAKKEFKEFIKFDINHDLFENQFEEIFNKHKYYFKNNNVIFFYDPLIISNHATGKVEFTFPVDKNSEN